MAASIDYVGNRGRENTRRHRRQRRTDRSRDGQDHAPRRQRLRSRRRTGPTGSEKHELRPVQLRSRRRSWGRRWTATSTRSSSASKNGSHPAGRDASATPTRIATTSRRSSSTAIRASTTVAATATTSTRSRRARNVDLGKGFGAGFVFRAYSGYPINEVSARARMRTATAHTNDRPMKGVNDLTLPIVSEVDSRGVAVRNGIDGEKKMILDGRVPVHPPHRPLPGGLVPRDLQPDQPRELRQPDRRP